MATYVQGYQPYMPDWQPFTPDYKFLSDVLDVKTNRYNTNYQAINDLYSKVVYSDLSRTDTQEMRNQYAENLGKQLQMVSGMDLSVGQNVDTAKQLFKPFYENDLIVKDLVFTKAYQRDMQYANALMTSQDREQREMYWQTGVKALEYQLQDFKNASSDKALSMGLPRYTPDADLYEKAIAYLKEQGLDVTQEYVDETGFWIVKDRNGNLITKQAYEMVQKALTDDPLVQQAYYTDAYVKSRDFAEEGIKAGRFQSVDEGQLAWATETSNRMEELLAARSLKQQEQVDELKNANISWDEYAERQGIIPGSNEEKTREQVAGDYRAALMGAKRTEETLQNANTSDQSTEGALNRAYSLLMGYNIQNDLSAAAISFSNMNRSRELKVNEYKKQQLQFQHDFSKMAMQFQYDQAMEGIKQSNRIKLEQAKQAIADPFGLSSLLGQAISYNELGTEEVPIDPETGLPIDPKEADYMKINDRKIEEMRTKLTGEQVDLMLTGLERIQPNANNYYVINDKIKGSLPEIKAQLLKPENAGVADAWFTKVANVMRDGDEVLKRNPNFVKSNNGSDYLTLVNQFNTVIGKRHALDNVVSTGNKVMMDNYQRLLKTDSYDNLWDSDDLKEAMSGGAPNIFTERNGNVSMYTKEEYVNKYVQLAKAGKLKGDEADESQRGASNPLMGAGVDWVLRGFNELIGNTYFSETLAKERAAEIYDMQRDAINQTLNGSLNTQAEEGSGDVSARKYQPWDPYQYMQGISLDAMESGDALKNPYYTTQIDPVTMWQSAEQSEALRNMLAQVKSTPAQTMVWASQSDFLNGDSGHETQARELYNYWIQDLARFRDGKATKGNLPMATVGYAPSYGNPDDIADVGMTQAAYNITFSPEWLNSVGKKLGYEDSEIEALKTITMAFPKNMDINARAAGNYNFSSVQHEVMSSPNHQMVQKIDGGGTLRVYPNAQSDLMMQITPLQYDPKSGNFVNMAPMTWNLSQEQRNAGESIGYNDNLVNKGLEQLGAFSRANNQAQSADKKTRQ